jgi:hypothetical protein
MIIFLNYRLCLSTTFGSSCQCNVCFGVCLVFDRALEVRGMSIWHVYMSYKYICMLGVMVLHIV